MYMYPASNVMFTLQGDDGCSELLVDFKYDDSVPMRKRKPNWITCLASVASKRILFAGDVNGQVSRISIADFALLETRKLHSACVTCMSCSTKNLFTASDDGTLKVWTFDLNQVSFDELILLTTVRYYNFMYMYMYMCTCCLYVQVGQFFPVAPVKRVIVSDDNEGSSHVVCGDQLGSIYFLNWIDSGCLIEETLVDKS